MIHAAIANGFTKLGELARDNGPLLLPLVLGFTGIYLLLPQARRSRPVLGAFLTGLALLVGGGLAIQVEAVLPEKILFYAFSGIAITAGTMLITLKNPVHAALSFALVVLSTCGLFLLQAAPFLMAATIVIYAGAIVVTFLFVIMLAQPAGISQADQRSREPFFASLAGLVMVGALLCILHKNYGDGELEGLLAQVRQIADAGSADQVISVMGDPDKQRQEALAHPGNALTHPLVEALEKYPYLRQAGAANLEVEWLEVRQPSHLAKLKKVCRRILQQSASQGSLIPPDLPLSTRSGLPANKSFTPAEDGELPDRRLPARNVAAIGTSLFTDYLVPVELAGMLLLVATIGAIAIAGRRAEGLR